ncbi:MAG: transporter [Acidobacteriia bacterium]|nr:transporter [Terriglobia bacterium]
MHIHRLGRMAMRPYREESGVIPYDLIYEFCAFLISRHVLCIAVLIWVSLAPGRMCSQDPNPPPPSKPDQASRDKSETKDDTGEEPDFIVPARPTVSNPAEFQRPGVLQLEMGYNSNFHARGVRSELDTPMAIRFAASRRILLEFDSDNVISQVNSDGFRMTSVGDTQIGIQGVAGHESHSRPGIAFAYYLKLPTASSAKGLGTGRVDHNFIGFVSKKIGNTTLDFNAVYLLAGRQGRAGLASSGQAALAASYNVTRKFVLEAEFSGFSRNDIQSGAIFGLGVIAYQVNRRLVFDAGIRTGFTRGSPRVGALAGLTVGVADFFKRHR